MKTSKRMSQWLRRLPERLVSCVAYSLLAVAGVIIVSGLVAYLTGNAGTVNRLLDNNVSLFGSPTYQPTTDPAVMSGIMNNFYPGMTTVAIIMAIMLIGVMAFIIASVLSDIGQMVANLATRLVGRSVSPEGAVYLAIFIVWALAILVTWLVLNVNRTVYFLLAECGLTVLNLGLVWLAKWLSKLIPLAADGGSRES